MLVIIINRCYNNVTGRKAIVISVLCPKEEKMTERKNSVVQTREKFMGNGGVFLGQEEWDEILERIPMMYDEYRKVEPLIDYCTYNFVDEVFKAANTKTGNRFVNGIWTPYCFEVRVRKNGKYYITLIEQNGKSIEKNSNNSEIMGYLAWKVLRGEMDFKKACIEYIHAKV